MKMERLNLLICLGLICVVTEASQLSPRGARPVEPSTRADKCDTSREWPFCTSDEWGPKCPSGCRIQGLMNKYDHSLLKRIEKIRSLLDQNKAKYRAADHVSKQTYDYLKEKLTIDAGSDNSYYDLAQNLRQKITDMKIKINRQLGVLAALKDRVKDQVNEMQRLEVDMDIKLRSCKGSCESYSEYQVDKESYVTLDKQINQLDSQSAQSIESAGTLYVMKSLPLAEAILETIYKSKDVTVQHSEDMFPTVNTNYLMLEEEGSEKSPATITKDQGTSDSHSTSSSSSSSASSSSSSSTTSKSITDLEGHGKDLFELVGFEGLGQPSMSHVSTQSVSCTKSIRRTVTETPEGPVEKMEEVIEGGPECQAMADSTKKGLAALFPTTSIKGSIFGGTKMGFGDPFGDPFGGDSSPFKSSVAEDDIPDLSARSVKSLSVERTADYVGEDCAKVHQHHLNGEKNGLFKIRPGGSNSTEVVEVYCQQDGLMGGWLLVQQRENGTLSFNRTWAEYRNGFGSVDANGKGEFWLGNQNLHLLTNQRETMMQVELEDWEGGKASAEYTVRVGPEEEGYPLYVSEYTGDAGDALLNAKTHLTHNAMKFSTFDKDNDKWEENCAEMYGGGWWYNNCQTANLNGIYYKGINDQEKNTPHEIENGVVWSTYKPAKYSLKTVKIKIRLLEF